MSRGTLAPGIYTVRADSDWERQGNVGSSRRSGLSARKKCLFEAWSSLRSNILRTELYGLLDLSSFVGAKEKRVPPKQMDLITIGLVGRDIDLAVFDKLCQYFQVSPSIALAMVAVERGDSNLHLHLQSVVSAKTTSIRVFKSDVSKAIGWYTEAPVGSLICVKSLTNRGLHTLTGLISYCLKDENEEHFKMLLQERDRKSEGGAPSACAAGMRQPRRSMSSPTTSKWQFSSDLEFWTTKVVAGQIGMINRPKSGLLRRNRLCRQID
ncbi:hypothetical protein R1sor_016594 [Riccia sorocarpa]|uniref:Replitron HUH endonuclease domain-containing protein n=1 Tax=Riccia sorocarpa TaxID=122646 RepID=A0ABD3HFE4_9MARC